jgi:hypothetical protein
VNPDRRPIPGWVGEYEFDSNCDVFTVERTITRSTGARYKIRSRRRRWSRHRNSYYMKLSRSGRYTRVWRHQLLELFNDTTDNQAAA